MNIKKNDIKEVMGDMVSVQMEKIPLKLDVQWDYNGSPYIQDNIITSGEYQYVCFWGEGGASKIMQRSIYGGTWAVFDKPLPDTVSADGHNVISMTVTRSGYIIITGNMHNNSCRCSISASPHNISAWKDIDYTSSTRVTYPRFVSYPDGTTQAFWREGGSGDGAYYSSLFDDENLVFGTKRQLIDNAVSVTSNPYEQRPVVDEEGVLHLCWGYRTAATNAATNFGLYYAKSKDKGLTWKNATGDASYVLPLTDANSEKIYDAASGSGYCNQNGACTDLNDYYHTVIWQYDESGFTQIKHIWFDGSEWQSEPVSDFDFTIPLENIAILDGTLSRPVIATTRYGKTFVFYHTTRMGRENHIRAIDVTTAGAPVDFVLCSFNTGTQSLSANTEAIRKTGVFEHLLSRGAAGNSQSDYRGFKEETAYLLSVMLP